MLNKIKHSHMMIVFLVAVFILTVISAGSLGTAEGKSADDDKKVKNAYRSSVILVLIVVAGILGFSWAAWSNRANPASPWSLSPL